MKRNRTTVRLGRTMRTGEQAIGNSRYAKKVAAGGQMYGDGKRCCAHRITAGQVERARSGNSAADLEG